MPHNKRALDRPTIFQSSTRQTSTPGTINTILSAQGPMSRIQTLPCQSSWPALPEKACPVLSHDVPGYLREAVRRLRDFRSTKFPLRHSIAVFPILADVVKIKKRSGSTAHWSINFIRLSGWLRRYFTLLITPLDIDRIGQKWEDSSIGSTAGEQSVIYMCVLMREEEKAWLGKQENH